MNYYIQGSPARAKEIKAAFEAKGCTLYRLISQCDSEDLIYYSLNGRVRCIKKDNLYLFEAHPGYTKLELPVKSKFKVGDCIANDYCAGKVIALTDDAYLLDSGQGIPFSCEHNAHLWTIAYAKEGDVLVTEDYIFIFKYILHGGVHLYCHYNIDDEEFDSDIPDAIIGNIHDKSAHFQPATKEQCDLLFAKMQESGYQWDAEKKELKKIQHYDIARFYAGMPVLVRDSDNSEWKYVAFSHYREEGTFCACGSYWYQCIPFKEDTEHLLGTTDMCPEEYINW